MDLVSEIKSYRKEAVSTELTDKLQKIYDHFGELHQKGKLIEEINEYLESGDVEEMADIFIVLYQHYLNNPEMRDCVPFKIDRTLTRIENNYY